MENQENLYEERIRLTRRRKYGTISFFIIAVLAVIHIMFLLFTEIENNYFIGFGITTTLLFFITNRDIITLVLILATFIIFVIFIILGVYSRKHYTWVFVTGFFFYAADSLPLILMQDWYSVILHGILSYVIYQGLNATREYNELNTQYR